MCIGVCVDVILFIADYTLLQHTELASFSSWSYTQYNETFPSYGSGNDLTTTISFVSIEITDVWNLLTKWKPTIILKYLKIFSVYANFSWHRQNSSRRNRIFLYRNIYWLYECCQENPFKSSDLWIITGAKNLLTETHNWNALVFELGLAKKE